jgi:hypothetical protein
MVGYANTDASAETWSCWADPPCDSKNRPSDAPTAPLRPPEPAAWLTARESRDAGNAAVRKAIKDVSARAAAQAEEMRQEAAARPKPLPKPLWRRALPWIAVALVISALAVYGVAAGSNHHGSSTHSVICRDGTVSEAGGHQGACSWHGGEAP